MSLFIKITIIPAIFGVSLMISMLDDYIVFGNLLKSSLSIALPAAIILGSCGTWFFLKWYKKKNRPQKPITARITFAVVWLGTVFILTFYGAAFVIDTNARFDGSPEKVQIFQMPSQDFIQLHVPTKTLGWRRFVIVHLVFRPDGQEGPAKSVYTVDREFFFTATSDLRISITTRSGFYGIERIVSYKGSYN